MNTTDSGVPYRYGDSRMTDYGYKKEEDVSYKILENFIAYPVSGFYNLDISDTVGVDCRLGNEGIKTTQKVGDQLLNMVKNSERLQALLQIKNIKKINDTVLPTTETTLSSDEIRAKNNKNPFQNVETEGGKLSNAVEALLRKKYDKILVCIKEERMKQNAQDSDDWHVINKKRGANGINPRQEESPFITLDYLQNHKTRLEEIQLALTPDNDGYSRHLVRRLS